MIIVDTALAERASQGNPIRLALVGGGYSARHIAHQVVSSFPGIQLAVIANRTPENARGCYEFAGITESLEVSSLSDLERAVSEAKPAFTSDVDLACRAGNIDVVLEASGTIEFGAGVVVRAIEHGKHVVLGNVELDATVGPIMKAYADDAGVIYSNSDGDEPGVAMNMLRFVRSIGLKPMVAGNLKGLYDRYRNPDTQQEFAAAHNQKPATMASFADGTKLSMELTVLANASGFSVGQRGMYGPKLEHVNDSPAFYADKLLNGGMVDFLCGAAPSNGAFVLGHTEDPAKQDYLKYLKMGEGPLYAFYTPFHLPQLEIPLTVARAALLNDSTVAPMGPPVCDAIAIAKRDLRAGETLDGLGGFSCYTLIENYPTARRADALPMGVSEGCVLKHAVSKDSAVTYADVELPAGRLCDRLRDEQDKRFATAIAD